MPGDFKFADLIILGLVALFIALRLRNTLGKDIGHPPADLGAALKPQGVVIDNDAVMVPAESAKPTVEDLLKLPEIKESGTAEQLVALREADPAFSVKNFIEGAKSAFEWVVHAYNTHDNATLKGMMAPDVYEDFQQAISERDTLGRRKETTLVALKTADVTKVETVAGKARISVRFETDQIQVEKDKEGKLLSGDPSLIHHVQDEWTFERAVKSRDPNWLIVAT